MRRPIHIRQRRRNRHIFPNRRQLLRQIRRLATGANLFAQFAGDFLRRRVNPVQRPVRREQFHRRFFADARNPGDIVRRVARERLHVHHLRRRDVIFLQDRRRRHFRHVRRPVLRQKHRRPLRHQLQRVPVPRHNRHGDFFFVHRRKRPDEIVPLEARQLILRDSQHAKHVPNQRKLRHELCRRFLPRPLVIGKQFHAKRFLALIETDRRILRQKHAPSAQKHPQKSVHRIRVHAVFGKRGQRIKRAVQKTVPVDNHQSPIHKPSYFIFHIL